jgi:hypothetical protein
MSILAAPISVIGLSACATTGNPETAGDFRVYENWCGPGHPRPGETPTPINDVDRACQTHDQCYADHGYLDRGCDDQLVARLQSIEPQDPIEDAARQTIIVYFENSPKID